MTYDSTDDVIKTEKRTEDKNKKRGSDPQELQPLSLILTPLLMQIMKLQDISSQCLEV